MKKQAEIEQLKKAVTETKTSVEQMKRTMAQQSRSSQAIKVNNYVVSKKPSISAKENNPTSTARAVLGAAADTVAESMDSHSHNARPQPSLRPQLQEAYNQLQKEIRAKTEAAKKRTDSYYCGDKKKINSTINPYITQAPAWIEASVEGNTVGERPRQSVPAGHERASKANNKSAMTTEERVHMRSSSHSNLPHGSVSVGIDDKRSTMDSMGVASMMRKTNYRVPLLYRIA